MHIAVLFACHAVISVSLTILNKKIVTEFPYPFVSVLLQCSLSVPIILLLNLRLRQIGPIRKSHLPSAMLVSSLFLACLTTSMIGLKRVHVPMVVVGKNLTPFFTAILETVIMKTPLRLQTLAPLLISIVGGAIYASGDANAKSSGILFVLLNSIVVAATSVSEKRVVSKDDQAPLGWSLYRESLAIPTLGILLAFGIEDVSAARDSLATASSSCWLFLCISASFSAASGCLIFMLQTRVRAATTQVANLCYKICTIAVSLMLFPESRRDMGWLAVLGYTLSMIGIAFYVLPGALTKTSIGTKVEAVTASLPTILTRIRKPITPTADEKVYILELGPNDSCAVTSPPVGCTEFAETP